MKSNFSSVSRKYEEVKEKLFVSCSNADKNREQLKKSPYAQLGDLAFTVDVALEWQEGEAPRISRTVTNAMLEMWKINEEKLFFDALHNSESRLPVTCSPMEDILQELLEFSEDGSKAVSSSGLYVITNQSRNNGAASIIYPGVLDRVHKALGDFYMIPSSVHEFLLIPDYTGTAVESMESTLNTMNRLLLHKEDVLSDRVYHYDGKMKKIELAEDYLKRRKRPYGHTGTEKRSS